MLKTILKKAAIGAVALAAFFGGNAALAGDCPVETEISLDFVSKYVWRGQLLADDPAFQPGATISAYGFSFNVWGSIDMTDVNEDNTDDWHLQELDYTLSYGFSPVEGLDLEGGICFYTFPGTMYDSTHELFVGASLSSVPYITPSITAYYDIDEVDGWYISAGLDFAETVPGTENLEFSLSTSVGWGSEDYNAFYWGVEEAAFNDFNISAGLCYTINDNFSVGVSVSWTKLLDDVCDAVDDDGGDTDQFYGGINATFCF